jgi:hypothetical protein
VVVGWRSRGERKELVNSPYGPLVGMPLGNTFHFFNCKGWEYQLGEFRIPGKRFSFIEREPEDIRVKFLQKREVAFNPRADRCEGTEQVWQVLAFCFLHVRGVVSIDGSNHQWAESSSWLFSQIDG